MTQYTKETILQNRIDALNALHNYVNTIQPLVKEYVQNNEIKRKTDYTLFKKNADEIKAIIDQVEKPNHARYYISDSFEHSLYVDFSIHYQVDEWGVNYYSCTVDLNANRIDNFVPYEIYDYDTCLDQLNNEIPKLKEIKRQTDSRLYELKRVLLGR